ncbi:hypothetical protein [Streptomyces sp. NPDC047071]|uniref:hypothetical protein n=1 Tax=Streptomyces sp. NPDC047071 TaxID=3154808 RepID=UPI003452ADB8
MGRAVCAPARARRITAAAMGLASSEAKGTTGAEGAAVTGEEQEAAEPHRPLAEPFRVPGPLSRPG